MNRLGKVYPDFSRLDLRGYDIAMNTDRDKHSRERVRAILSESVSVLCRTMLKYDAELSIRGLLGITLDNREVFLVDILETVHGRNHDVSDVAVIDPGKEDSEGDMLVVDDSDMEGDKGQNRAAHNHTNDTALNMAKTGVKCSNSPVSNQTEIGHSHTHHLTHEPLHPRPTLGLKELGDAAFTRSLNHIQQMASKTLMKGPLNMAAGLSRHSTDSGSGVVEGMPTQVLTTSNVNEAEPMTTDHHADPNFRLQPVQQQQQPDKQVNNREQQQQQHHHHHQQEQPQPMYALCACENTGDANDCALKSANSQTQAVWSHSETGEYVQTPISLVSQSSTASTGVHVIPTTTVLSNHDPYQLWNKAHNNAATNGQVVTTPTWQTLPAPPTVSTIPTSTWPAQSAPQQPQPVVTSKTNSEPIVAAVAAAAAAATAPIQNLYSSLPETISSAILHTTYTQSNTPKNLRGEGVFPCKLCSRVFTYKKSKARHMKRHLGEFFTCEVCKKSFCRKDVLARHQHNVHGVKLEVPDNEKSPTKSEEQPPPTLSMLSQQPAEVNSPNSYPLSQTPAAGSSGHQHSGRNFETVEFSSATGTQLTVPRPQLAVVTSIPQPIQSFLTLNHPAITAQHQNTAEQHQPPQSTLHHGASTQT